MVVIMPNTFTSSAQKQLKRWFTVAEAAEYLGCCRNFLDRDRVDRLHRIPFSHLGRHIRYDRLDLDEWLERGKVLQ
jgi:excisionase family DNA binding protein